MHDLHAWLQVYGFLDGPHGIYSGEYIELTAEVGPRRTLTTEAARCHVTTYCRGVVTTPAHLEPTDLRRRDLRMQRIAPYRNQGGFDMIGSGRHKIETDEQCVGVASAVPTHSVCRSCVV